MTIYEMVLDLERKIKRLDILNQVLAMATEKNTQYYITYEEREMRAVVIMRKIREIQQHFNKTVWVGHSDTKMLINLTDEHVKNILKGGYDINNNVKALQKYREIADRITHY